MGGIDQHPPARQPFRRHQVHQSLLLGVNLLLGQGRDLDDELAAGRVEDRLAVGAAVGVGQQGLQVSGQQPLGTLLQRLDQRLVQFLEDVVVGAALGEAGQVSLRVHPRQQHLLLVGGQGGGHVCQLEKDRVADDVEQSRRHQAGLFPHRLAEALAPAGAPVLVGVVLRVAAGLLQEAVALDPAALLGVGEVVAQLRREPVEEVEESAGIASHQSPGQAEGLADDVGQHPGGDALGGTAPLVLVNLVPNQQVEEAPHPVLHVVGQGIAPGAGAVGLPQGIAAAGAVALAAAQFAVGQGNAVLVRHLAVAGGAAGHLEGLPGLVVPHQAGAFRGPPLDDGGLPAVGQLGPLPAHHREQGAGAGGEAQPLQVGDGGDDGGPGQGDRLLHLPLPLLGQVGRAQYEHPPEAGGVGGGGADEGLAGAHFADHGGAPVGLQGEGRAPDGVGLRPQGSAEQLGQLFGVFRGPVEGRVGLHHPSGDGVLEGVDELSEVHGNSPCVGDALSWDRKKRRPRR